MSDIELYVKDWEMTKDRIKHFDDIVMRIRVQSIPISSAFFIGGWGLHQEGYSWAPYLFIIAAFYIFPIALLDYFHYILLTKSVAHAIHLERKYFDNKIQVTQKLTTPYLTTIHGLAAACLYIFIFWSAIYCFNVTTL